MEKIKINWNQYAMTILTGSIVILKFSHFCTFFLFVKPSSTLFCSSFVNTCFKCAIGIVQFENSNSVCIFFFFLHFSLKQDIVDIAKPDMGTAQKLTVVSRVERMYDCLLPSSRRY
jgi:hypothetical protein